MPIDISKDLKKHFKMNASDIGDIFESVKNYDMNSLEQIKNSNNEYVEQFFNALEDDDIEEKKQERETFEETIKRIENMENDFSHIEWDEMYNSESESEFEEKYNDFSNEESDSGDDSENEIIEQQNDSGINTITQKGGSFLRAIMPPFAIVGGITVFLVLVIVVAVIWAKKNAKEIPDKIRKYIIEKLKVVFKVNLKTAGIESDKFFKKEIEKWKKKYKNKEPRFNSSFSAVSGKKIKKRKFVLGIIDPEHPDGEKEGAKGLFSSITNNIEGNEAGKDSGGKSGLSGIGQNKEEDETEKSSLGFIGISNVPEEKTDEPKKQMKDILPEFKELDECSDEKKRQVEKKINKIFETGEIEIEQAMKDRFPQCLKTNELIKKTIIERCRDINSLSAADREELEKRKKEKRKELLSQKWRKSAVDDAVTLFGNNEKRKILEDKMEHYNKLKEFNDIHYCIEYDTFDGCVVDVLVDEIFKTAKKSFKKTNPTDIPGMGGPPPSMSKIPGGKDSPYAKLASSQKSSAMSPSKKNFSGRDMSKMTASSDNQNDFPGGFGDKQGETEKKNESRTAYEEPKVEIPTVPIPSLEKLKKKIIKKIAEKKKKYLNCSEKKKDKKTNIQCLNLDSVILKCVYDLKIATCGLSPASILQNIFETTEADICPHIPTKAFIPYMAYNGVHFSAFILRGFGDGMSSKWITKFEQLVCAELLPSVLQDLVKPIKKVLVNMVDQFIKGFEEQISEKEKERKKKKIAGGGVIGEGTYGCIFRPHLLCNGKEVSKKNDKYVTKLLINYEWRIISEYQISQKVRKIKNYKKYFAPLLDLCDIDTTNISSENKKKCKLIKKNIRKTRKKKMIAKMRYIDNLSYIDYISKQDLYLNYLNFLNSINDILKAIELLQTKNILHCDLHSGNVIYDKKQKRVMCIDFGLAVDMEHIHNLYDAFSLFFDAEWTMWPVEMHMLSFIVSNNRKMRREEFIDFLRKYIKKHRVFNKLMYFFTDVEKNKYEKEYFSMFMFYDTMNMDNLTKYLLNNFWKTWDTHSLSVLFLRMFSIFNDNSYTNFRFNIEFIKLFFNNMDPDPRKRLSIKNTIKEYNKILKLLTPEIANNVRINTKNMGKMFKKSLKQEETYSLNIFKNKHLV